MIPEIEDKFKTAKIGWCDKCENYSLCLTHTEDGVLCRKCLGKMM